MRATDRKSLRIGVTGHRFLAKLDRLTESVDAVFLHLERKFPDQALAIVSSLAEGADRLAVTRFLRRGNRRLIAVLPMPQSDYEQDFESAESKRQFREMLRRAARVIVTAPAAPRERAYGAAGDCLLRNSDILLAIWDGRDAHGKGGTGDVVASARKMGLPIAWIHAGNRIPGEETPTSLGEDQGKVTFENL